MNDMSVDVFAQSIYGKVALRKLAPLPDNFRLFSAEKLGEKPGDWVSIKVTGAEFRQAKSGPNMGKLCIKVEGTMRSAYVTKEEMAVQDIAFRCIEDTHRMLNTRITDWQVVKICPAFVIELDCNGDRYRRVYPDGRVELIDQ